MKKEIEEAKRMREELVKNFQPEVEHTKAAYLSSLNEDTRTNILIHFNKITQCTELSERDFDLVWLAWIVGEKLLLVSEEFIMNEMSEVEFEHQDYELTFEDKIPGKSNIDTLREYYFLDQLYEEVLKSR